MRRRQFVTAVGGGAVWALGARAQQPTRIYRVGLLRVGSPPPSFIEPFRQGLRDLGYVEGQNLEIHFGLAASAEQLPEIAADLIRRNVDIIVASGAASVLPARNASTTRPVVFVAGIDPIALGLVTDNHLGRPGANITGLTTLQIDLTAKRLELLKDVLPEISRVAFLSRTGNPGNSQYVHETQEAARALGLTLQIIPARGPDDFEDAFRAALGAGALVPMDDAVFTASRRKLVELAEKYRLPGIYPIREFVLEGGLMSLGPNYPEVYRRAAVYVDKVLKGTNPADLPVEQPTSFELVVNLKTAKALGLTLPQSILLRAEVIE
jgi:putative tryptophan/tyrosine transport system substrate-binding protein